MWGPLLQILLPHVPTHCALPLLLVAAAGSGLLGHSWPAVGKASWWRTVPVSPKTASGQDAGSIAQGLDAVPKFST